MKLGGGSFMEGMICKEIGRIQRTHTGLQASQLSAEKWGVGLVTKLLEVTHGQWLNCNIQVCDNISGTLVTLRKEKLQLEIEWQQELGAISRNAISGTWRTPQGQRRSIGSSPRMG